MSNHVPFYRHALDASNAERVAQVLASPILTSGNVCKSVEKQLAEFFGTRFAGLTNSWTNGALAALLAMDIGPGDEVVVPAMTFISSANVVEMVGAKPVFVDVEPETLLVSISGVRSALTSRTKAVIPVHLYGQMVDIRKLRSVLDAAGRADVKIVEDSAHCFEGRFGDYGPGQESDIALFSFYATKNVTCGEGGAFVTNSDDLFAKMLQVRLHGMTAGAIDRYEANVYHHWDMVRLGIKANLPDILAALLPDQIATIRQRLALRETLAGRYEAQLRNPAIRLPILRAEALSARHIFPIHVNPGVRDRALQILNAAGVGIAVNFRSVPTMTYYQNKYGYTGFDFPVSYEWGQGEITLPMFPGMRADEQDYVISVIYEKILPLMQI